MTATSFTRKSYLDDRMSSILSKHPPLGMDENRQLGFTFCAQQQDVARYLASLVYPFLRLITAYRMGEIESGRLGGDIEGKDAEGKGIQKIGYRAPRFTKLHFEKIESYLAAINHAASKADRDSHISELYIYFSTTFSFPCLDLLFGYMGEPENGVDVNERVLRRKAKNAYLLAVESRTQLIQGNYQLAAKAAYSGWKRIASSPAAARVDLHDLFSDAVRLGLNTAVDGYNPERYAFSTYAFNWVQNAVSRSIKRNGNLLTVPFAQQGGDNDRIQEFSLDAPLNPDSDGDEDMHSILADGTTEGPVQMVQVDEVVQAVALILGDMDPTHALLMGLRLGVGDVHASARALLFKEFQRSKAMTDDIWAKHQAGFSTLPNRVVTYTRGVQAPNIAQENN